MDEVEEIRNKIDIVELIGSYVPLKQAGRNFKGLSPFKNEKTPSFMVSPEKNIWHDFSSGEGGDVFSFVMKMDGVSFPEALEMLARRAGVQLKPRRAGGTNSNLKQKLFEATEQAVKYYHLSLSKNKRALEYLTSARGIKPETIKEFKLGYAPESWEALTNYLGKKGFDLETLKKAGLAGQNTGRKNGYDLFRGRVMFPIYDNQGRAVGFSGRILDGDEKSAKYINSPQTLIYNKSTVIYGLSNAKDAIRETKEALMVEGNMDVVGLWQAGVKNAVAVSGTALSTEQLKSLKYLAEQVLICFDNDEAGERATYRAISLGAEAGVNLKVISLPKGKDPDELVRRDKKAFVEAYEKAKGGVDYVFERAEAQFDKSGVGKKHYSDYVMAVVNKLSDPIEQDHYVKKLAQKLDVNESAVRNKLAKSPYEPSSDDGAEETVINPKPDKKELIEQSLLEILLAYDFARDCLKDLDNNLISKENQPIFEYLTKEPNSTLNELTKALPELANRAKILTLRGEEAYSGQSRRDISLEAYSQSHQLRKMQQKAARNLLLQKLTEAERTGDTKTRDKILAKIQQTLNEDL